MGAEDERGERRQLRVTVDTDGPLAAKALTHEVTVAGMRDADNREIRTGKAQSDLSVLR